MHNRNAAGLGRMFELNVATFLRDLPPAIRSKCGDHIAAIH
jgi:hypothetical protein